MGGVSYEFCNRLLLGLATIRSRQLDSRLIPVAVWNGRRGDGPGGAARVIASWRGFGLGSEIVDFVKISGESAAAVSDRRNNRSDDQSRSPRGFTSRIVAILFADAVGFSKLSEPEVPCF